MTEELSSIVSKLSTAGRGILASDESPGTIGRRLQKAGKDNTEEHRRAYREFFYTAPIGEYIAGVILHQETLFQRAADGRLFVDCLTEQGVLPGIKVDEGLHNLEGTDGETVTNGLETLSERCKVYHRGHGLQNGGLLSESAGTCRLNLSSRRMPFSWHSMRQHVRDTAISVAHFFIELVQAEANGLVPIVEPELLIDGDHSMSEFEQTSHRMLSACIAQLWNHNIDLETTLLKPQMIIPGTDWKGSAPSSEDIAGATLRVMRRNVPPAIPGIMFLSGGQSEEEATVNLNTINVMAQRQGRAPWTLSFSFGRGLQASVMKLWQDRRSRQEIQQMATSLARVNAAAVLGQFTGPHPSITSHEGGLHETFRGWAGRGHP